MDIMEYAFDFVTMALLGVFALFDNVVSFLNLYVFFGTMVLIFSVYRFIVVPFLSGKISFGGGKDKKTDNTNKQNRIEKKGD